MWIDTCCIDKSSSAELRRLSSKGGTVIAGAEYANAYLSDFPSGIDVHVVYGEILHSVKAGGLLEAEGFRSYYRQERSFFMTDHESH